MVERVAAARGASNRLVVVGASGCCGSGKSTLARELTAAGSGRVRMRGDAVLDPVRFHRRSPDWDGVECDRLAAEMSRLFRAGRAGTFRRYDRSRRMLGEPEPKALPQAGVLVADLIGLFHPEVLDLLDVTV